MDRRHFLTIAGAAGSALAFPGLVGAAPQERRYPLRRLESVAADGLTLTAGVSTADFGSGRGEAWTLNSQFPAPTLRIRRGEPTSILLRNELTEPTILHWHGLDVPEAADGHPRYAIAPGQEYRYDFTVKDRAGLYWYHPHTHGRTAPQTYRGMAGLLVVEDEGEQSLELPSGEFELPLLLQDKRAGGGSPLQYAASMGPDMMFGYLGDTPFANGVAHPTVEVRRGLYRLRVLNGSNARIFDLGLSTGAPMTLIGSDGGFLERAAPIGRVMMSTGERADLLVDFSGHRPGDRVILRSLDFRIPGMMGMGGMGGMGGGGRGMGPGGMMGRMAGIPLQGAPMDLLEFVVGDGPVETSAPLPDTLSVLPAPSIDASTPRREFRFDSMMMNHTINGRTFGMERVDLRVPRGRTEVWSLVNASSLPHPVHVHVGQFRVLSRRGGRGRVMPWETGLKDTVLVLPGEQVDIAVRFDEHPGLFLMHCHNLEHEDMGMMMNFQVE